MRNKPACKEWLKGVVEAIRELHALKIARFDIRLPNICFKEDDTPVLIDLDRSVVENNFTMRRDFDTLRTKYKNSEMYSIHMNVADDGNPDQVRHHIYKLDHKQLAIMLLDLVNNDSNMMYNHEPTNLQSFH